MIMVVMSESGCAVREEDDMVRQSGLRSRRRRRLPDDACALLPLRMERADTTCVLAAFIEVRSALGGFLSRFMIASHEIDDLAQEAFLRTYQVERKRKRIEQPKAFLFRVARNLALDSLHRSERSIVRCVDIVDEVFEVASSYDLEADIIRQETLLQCSDAIAALSPQCREVLIRRADGMSHKEIAGRMGIAVSTVEKHLSRAIRQCRSLMTLDPQHCADQARALTSSRRRP